MSKKVKFLSAALAAVTTFSVTSISASAAEVTPRISQYYLAEGVGDVDYFITDSASEYTSLIGVAANSWVYTGYGYNPIYMYHTLNFSESNMDIYAQYDGIDVGYIAKTCYVDVTQNGHVEVSPSSSFWDYGQIYLNKTFFTELSSWEQQGVIAHEMGHVFGLEHNNDNIYSILCQMDSGRVVNTPGLADHYGINAMY